MARAGASRTRSRPPGSRGTRRSGPSPSRPVGRGNAPDPDTEFVAGHWEEASPQSLDFDDELASRRLAEREPEDDFGRVDGYASDVRGDAADLADLFGGAGDDAFGDDWDDLDAHGPEPR